LLLLVDLQNADGDEEDDTYTLFTQPAPRKQTKQLRPHSESAAPPSLMKGGCLVYSPRWFAGVGKSLPFQQNIGISGQ